MKILLISVIIPIYNVSDYVDVCVESVCRQSYVDLEIILVDDGSTDDCPQKCDEWASRDSRIKVIHKANGGLSDARNAGLDIATGKYIYFLDGDDSIQPNLIETVVKYMEDGADMTVFRFKLLYDNGNIEDGQPHEINTFLMSDEESRRDFVLEKLLSGKLGWEAWSRIYRRDKIEKYHLRFADNEKIFAEDLCFCLCYSAHAEKVVSIPDVLYNYSVRQNSIMRNQQKNLNIGRMNELCKEVNAFFSKWGDCSVLLKSFPVIHFMIIDGIINKSTNLIDFAKVEEMRQIILADISDVSFFTKQVEKYFKNRRILERYFSGFYLAERLSIYRYLLNSNRIGLALRNHLLYRFKETIDCRFGSEKTRFEEIKKALRHKDTIVVVGTEDFGNIGDHQIAVSMLAFLKEKLEASVILEITASQYAKEKKFLFKNIKSHHLVVMPGGGNFGNIYPFAQTIREEIILNLPENKKIIFPQTIHFSDDNEGDKALSRAITLFSKSNNVCLFTRDDVSFEFAKKYFSCDICFAPDIVLWDRFSSDVNSNGNVLVCLRDDIESSVSVETRSAIKGVIQEHNLNTVSFDTQLTYNVPLPNRESVTKATLELWASSKIVITDRLHGLVFAAITGTPCIAFANCNHKVKGTYEYLKSLPYVAFAETIDEFETALNRLIEIENKEYDNTCLESYFKNMESIIKKLVKGKQI